MNSAFRLPPHFKISTFSYATDTRIMLNIKSGRDKLII